MANKQLSEKRMLHIEAAINLIPYVGGFVATYFGETRSQRVQQRMHDYIAYFSDRLESLEERKIDKRYLESEEFAELFLQGAENASRSTTKKRIRRFANILINNSLIGAKARDRTQSIMSFVDRISDLDGFVLLCYGTPSSSSLRASSKIEALGFVTDLCRFLSIKQPSAEEIYESIIYMDNLGLTWVNENETTDEKGKDIILGDFSSFRTPLGDAVVSMISPVDFFREDATNDLSWPKDIVSGKYFRTGDL